MGIKPTKAQLWEMYVEKHMTRAQIAKELSIGDTTVLKYMKEYDIPRRTVAEYLRGKPKSLAHRQKLSESKQGSKHPNYGKKRKNHGKRCWYTLPDGRTVSMRSQWEIWYAEYLNQNQINYTYEEHTFVLIDGSAYTPDFYLTDTKQFVEVKGWFTPEHRERVAKFRTAYPEAQLIVADKEYLSDLGIDLRNKWIASKPKFPCEECGHSYHRSYPSQRFCSIKCRNKAIAKGVTTNPLNLPKRKYRGSQTGERNNSCKISESTVQKIRQLHQQGKNNSEIARTTNTTPGNVSNIVNGKSWKHVK